MNPSEAKLTANRRNALKSTGPRSKRGKARVRRNAVTHGIFCNDLVLPGESRRAFKEFRHAILIKLSPQDMVELLLCDRIVSAAWRLRRVNAAQRWMHLGLAQNMIDTRNEETASLQEQLFQQRLQLGETNASAAVESEMIDDPAKLPGAAVLAHECLSKDSGAERLSKYEQRIEYTIHRSLRQLQQLRKQCAEQTETVPPRCPFVPDSVYEAAREALQPRVRKMENKANAKNELNGGRQ